MYSTATRILESRLNPGMVLDLYRELKTRDIEPDQWDLQIKFWSSVLKRWGDEANVLDFAVDQLQAALVYEELLPPLQPTLNFLVTTKILQSRESCLSPPSVISQIWAFVSSADPPSSDSYIFQANLRERVGRLASHITSQAAVITDLCCTREELFVSTNDEDIDLLCAELDRSKKVAQKRDRGYLFYHSRIPKIDLELADAILSTKSTLARIAKELDSAEAVMTREYERARRFKAEGRDQLAMNCLRLRKAAERRIPQLHGLEARLRAQLDDIANGDITNQTAEHLRAFGQLMRRQDLGDVDALLESVEDTRAAGDELAAAVIPPQDDGDLEDELNDLLGIAPHHEPEPRARPRVAAFSK
jgi:hypothetical protein